MRSLGVVPLAVCLACCVAGGVRADDGPAATPQRPSLATNTSTVPRGLFELEAGAGFAEGSAALPLLGKYGLTDRLELDVGVDAVRWVDGPGQGETSPGDLLLGARWRATGPDARVQYALAGLIKLPTADEPAGSGELDATIAGIASIPLERGLALDLNLVWTSIGRQSGGSLGQGQAIAALGIPLEGRWSSFLEAAYQRTAGQDDGGFVDAGVSYAATPRAVFDLAVGAGWESGYPDWTATVGWTVLFADRGGSTR